MMSNQNCNTASLAPYVPSAQNEWNEQKAEHLFRRISYGVGTSEINSALASNALYVPK